jgi:hypothetical protein
MRRDRYIVLLVTIALMFLSLGFHIDNRLDDTDGKVDGLVCGIAVSLAEDPRFDFDPELMEKCRRIAGRG